MSQPNLPTDPQRAQIEALQAELARLQAGKTNKDFVQVSRKYLQDLDTLAFQSKPARKLLTTLVLAMDRSNAVVVSQDVLVKMTGMSKATIKRAVAHLREQKWIEVVKSGTANIYRINKYVFWQSRAEGKFAAFGANVVIGWDEQDEVTQAIGPGDKLRKIEAIHEGQAVVTGTQLGSEDPPEQGALDFHKGP